MKAGEEVASADEWTGDGGYSKVTRTFKRQSETLLTIRTDDGKKIEATPEHPFWVEGKGFIVARKLARSDLLRAEDGHNAAVVSVTERRGKFAVYNLEVAGAHTYYAGGWWVHNDCTDEAMDLMMGRGEGWAYRLEPSDPYLRQAPTGGLGEGGWGYHLTMMCSWTTAAVCSTQCEDMRTCRLMTG